MTTFIDYLLGGGSRSSGSSGSSGFTDSDASTLSAVIARAREEADREYELNKRKADNEYRTALMNARTSQEVQKANARYQQQQYELAREKLTFDKQMQEKEFGLKQAELGYGLIKTAAELRGPSNYFQASNYARGVANQAGTSSFLTALQNNTRLRDYGGQSGSPDAETIGTLTAKLGGGGGSGDAASSGSTSSGGSGTMANASDNALLNQTHALGAAGAHKIGAGGLESLSSTELSLLLSGLEAGDENGKAYDAATFLDQYRRSRIGQGVGGGMFKAA